MTSENPMSSEQLPSTLRLSDNFVPGIGAGTYRLAVQQTVSFGNESYHYYREQRFVVAGPRYTLPEDEIHARYPPDGGVGDYSTTLPHLVLGKRALPWERSAWQQGEGEVPLPWLALLLLSQTEIDDAAQKLGLQQSAANPPAANPLLTTMTPKALQATGGDAQTRLPQLKNEQGSDDEQTQVRLLQLPLDLFLQLCPTKAELPYLAHVRTVDPSDKVPLNMPAIGDFAVLVGNRLPSVGVNVAFLVSLEGLGDLLDNPPSQAAETEWVNLIMLASWTFNNDAAGVHTFRELMQNLDVAPLAVCPPSAGGQDPAGDYVSRALANGYTPLRYRPFRAAETFGWYRGPFTPRPVTSLPADLPLFQQTDAALIYDPASGLYDFSYAAAYQLGRLHALSTPSVAQALRRFVDAQHDAFAVAQAVEQLLEAPADQASEIELGPAEVAAPAAAPAQADDPQPPLSRVQMADALLPFLAELALLYPLPFAYLVAHPKLLPPESIRFFYIDDNYIDALIEGALSIGQDCTRDRQVVATARDQFDQAVSQLVYQYRRRLQALKHEPEPPAPPDAGYLGVQKSGFLLRSALVADWPGVEVRCYDQQGAKIPVLRLDHLAADLLLCIAAARVDRVEIKEPDEGLHFGFDDDGQIMLRQVQGASVGAPLPSDGSAAKKVEGKVWRAAAPPGVLDINTLQATLAGAVEQPIGPAAFALQLLWAPETQQFDLNGHALGNGMEE